MSRLIRLMIMGPFALVAVGVHPGSALPGETFRDCPECQEMVVIPAGSFIMGSPASEESHRESEAPQHRVTIPTPFAVGKYEVIFREWDACVADGGCGGYWPKDEGWGRGDRPVIHISWEYAQSYVGWLSRKTGQTYRLLSESEWEYVARAGTTGPFFTGSTVGPNEANYDANFGKTVAVGSFPPNAFGVYDTIGNVREWVEDCWNNSYTGAPDDGTARTPRGDCDWRILRGGSWINFPRGVRAAFRDWGMPVLRNESLGFRIARTL